MNDKTKHICMYSGTSLIHWKSLFTFVCAHVNVMQFIFNFFLKKVQEIGSRLMEPNNLDSLYDFLRDIYGYV